MWLRTLSASFSFSKISPRCFSMFICSARVMGCFVYSILKRNVPPWSAGLATRSVVGFVGAKVLLFSEMAKQFEGKCSFEANIYVFFAVFSVVAAVPPPTVASFSPPTPIGTAWTDIRSNTRLSLFVLGRELRFSAFLLFCPSWTRFFTLQR